MIEVYYENKIMVRKYLTKGVIITNDTITLINDTEEHIIVRVKGDKVSVRLVHQIITDEEVKGKQA